jgi:hypothetical protein
MTSGRETSNGRNILLAGEDVLQGVVSIRELLISS